MMLWEGLRNATGKNWTLQWQAQQGGEKDGILDRTKAMTKCAKVEFIRPFLRTKSNIQVWLNNRFMKESHWETETGI